MKRRKNTTQIWITAAAFILAAFMWLFVVNTQFPTRTVILKRVPVTIRNTHILMQNELAIKNFSELETMTVKVKLSGSRLKVDQVLKQNTLVSATIDLNQVLPVNDLKGETKSVSKAVPITLSSRVLGVSTELIKESSSVEVIVEPYIKKDFAVDVLVNHQIEEALGLTILQSDPVTVQVSGGLSVVDTIDKAVAIVKIEGEDFMGNHLYETTVSFYTSEETEINIPSQKVFVPLNVGYTKEVPVVLDLSLLDDKLDIVSVTGALDKVELIGEASQLDQIELIKTAPTLIAPEVGKASYTCELLVPEGVYIVSPQITSLDLSVLVEEKQTYDVIVNTKALSFDYLNFNPRTKLKVLSEEIPVRMVAVPSKYFDINQSICIVAVDLEGLSIGKHKVPLVFESVEGVKIVPLEKLEVEIISR